MIGRWNLRVKLVGAAMAVALLSGMVRLAESPVADAAQRGDLELVRSLIKRGADVNAPQPDGMTALHWAAELGSAPIAEALIKARANPSAGTRIGSYTPLHLASQAADPAVVKLLLAAGSDANAVTSNSGVTPLHLAAASGHPEVVSALLDRGAKADAREPEWGQTPLMFAAAYNRAEAVRVLLAKGASADLVSRTVVLREQSALDAEANRKRTELLAELRGEDRRNEPTSAQIQEAIRISREVYRAAIDLANAPEEKDTTERDPDEAPPPTGLVSAIGGLTALHYAAREGSIEAAKELIHAGANLNVQSGADKSTPLLMATLNGQFDLAMVLIDRGADPNLVSEAGTSPLYGTLERRWANRTRYPQPIAVDYQKTGHLEVLDALLKAGANPNVQLNRHLYYMTYTGCGNSNCGLEQVAGATPFWRAAYATDVDAMRLLASHGADPMTPTRRATGGGGRGGAGAAAGAAAGRAGAAGARGGAAQARGGGAGVARGGAAAGDAGAGVAGAAAGVGGAVAADSTARGATATAAGAARAAGAAIAAAGATPVTDPGASGGRGGAAADPSIPLPPPGVGVYPIHAAAGVGYGQGFAGNSHRHAPDGWLPAVKFLVEEMGVDVNLRDVNGYTPLHHAAARGDNELILYLVSKGADVKAVSVRGQTTADMANGPVSRITPFPETVKLLESLGSKNNHRCASC